MRIAIGRAPATLLLLAAVTAQRAPAQVATLASVDSSGNQANRESGTAAVSRDGRFVAFASYANNLVAGDTGFNEDVFVHDTKTGATERDSVDSSGGQANTGSDDVAISADGRFVAFSSYADNLVASDGNGCQDVFVHDRATGTTDRASVDSGGVEGNGDSRQPALSADGRFVAFLSVAKNLVAGGTSGTQHVFVRDRASGTTELASVSTGGTAADADSLECAISADGRFVAFSTGATDLDASDTNGTTDVYLRDRQLGTTVRCSLDSSGNQGSQSSFFPGVSADGNSVVFQSTCSSFELAGSSGDQIFVRDVAKGTLTQVSVDSSGNPAQGECDGPSLSADGRFVAFSSWAANLASDPNVIGTNVFQHDRVTGRTTWYSANRSGKAADGDSGDEDNREFVAISSDGARVAYWSSSDDLVASDTNLEDDVFVSGAPLTLTADPESAAAGVTVNFDFWRAKASSTVLLFATEVDRVACAIPVGGGTCDGNGEWTLSAVVPFGLTGHQVVLTAFALLPSGKVGASNGKIITLL
jgi:Tol biopolymer transport system component